MALGGTYQDHYMDMFKDLLLQEAQQQGSRLIRTVMAEKLEGNKTFFDKLGKLSAARKTSRNQTKTYSDATFERRQVQEVFNTFNHNLDKEDLIKYVKDPRNELVQAAVWELGRVTDEVIMDALGGNAVVTTNGSTANQALTQTIAVNDHTYNPGGSGDAGLTTSKLKLALRLIKENYGMGANEEVFCAAPTKHIMNLTTEAQQVSSDYRSGKPLEGPGINALSGFMGITFIEYEDTGTDASGDEYVYVYTASALKFGHFLPLTVEFVKNINLEGNPDSLSVYEAIGCTRMYEEKVVQIACDPLAQV